MEERMKKKYEKNTRCIDSSLSIEIQGFVLAAVDKMYCFETI
jgi:hypothetical protein